MKKIIILAIFFIFINLDCFSENNYIAKYDYNINKEIEIDYKSDQDKIQDFNSKIKDDIIIYLKGFDIGCEKEMAKIEIDEMLESCYLTYKYPLYRF